MGSSAPAVQAPVERIAVVDWSRIERVVDGVEVANFDNASTQVVQRRQYAEVLGVDVGIPLWTITDAEDSKNDQASAKRAKEEILKDLAVQLTRGPQALAELMKVKQLVQAELQRKLKTVNAAADADAARLGQVVSGLEATELVCEVVTIWSPAGAASRAGKIVSWVGRAKAGLQTVEGFRQRVGGVTGLVAAYEGDADGRARVGAAAAATLVEVALDWGVAKAGRKIATRAKRRLRNSEVTALIPSTFAGPAAPRRYANSQVKRIMWRAEKVAKTADRVVEPADRVGSLVVEEGRRLLAPGRAQRLRTMTKNK